MRRIDGFPNYSINAQGEVFSHNHGRKTANGEIVPKKMKPFRERSGMLRYNLWNDSGRYIKYAHDLVLSTYGEKRKADEVAFHKDGDMTNNASSNLKWVKRDDLAVEMVKISKDPDDIKAMRYLKREIKRNITKERYAESSMFARIKKYERKVAKREVAEEFQAFFQKLPEDEKVIVHKLMQYLMMRRGRQALTMKNIRTGLRQYREDKIFAFRTGLPIEVLHARRLKQDKYQREQAHQAGISVYVYNLRLRAQREYDKQQSAT